MIVAGTVTGKIFVQIVTGDHFCIRRTLGEYDPDVFSVGSAPLQSKRWARTAALVRLVEIDDAFLHYLADLFFAYVPAVHAAQGVLCVNQ